MDINSYNNVSPGFKAALDKSAKNKHIENSEVKKLIDAAVSKDDLTILHIIVQGDKTLLNVNIGNGSSATEYKLFIDDNDFTISPDDEIIQEPVTAEKLKTVDKNQEKELLYKQLSTEITKVVPPDKAEKWQTVDIKDEKAVKDFINTLTISPEEKVKLQKLVTQTHKSAAGPEKYLKELKNQDRAIPIDQLTSIPAATNYLLNEFAGVKPGDLKLPDELDKIIGNGKVGQAIDQFDHEVLAKVRDAGVDPETSNKKAIFKSNQGSVVAGYQQDDKSGTVSTNFKNEGTVQLKTAEDETFSGTMNVGNINSLADSTPANINKFKNAAKPLLIPEKDAMKLHDDLVTAKTEKEKLEVMDSFVKANGSKGYAYVKSLGWIDKSVNFNVSIDGKSSVLEISRQSIMAGVEIAGTGGKAGFNKQTGTVVLKAKMAGKEVDLEVSKENFRAAFGDNKNHAALQFSKTRLNIDFKGLKQEIQLKVEKGDYRIGAGLGSYQYSFSYKNKEKFETTKFTNEETCQAYNVVSMNYEKGLGATATLPTPLVAIKAGVDKEKDLFLKIMKPTASDEKTLNPEEAERLKKIGEKLHDEKIISMETAQSLEPGEIIKLNRINKFDMNTGLSAEGVNLKGQLDKVKDYKMTVEAFADNKVKVSVVMSNKTKIGGEIETSGNSYSREREKGINQTIELECDLNTEAGQADYQKLLSEIAPNIITKRSNFSADAQNTLLMGDGNQLTKKQGLSITVAALTRTKDLKVNHNPDGTTTITTDLTRKQEDKKIPVVKKALDDEIKITHGTGVIGKYKMLTSGEITMEINDSRFSKHEVRKYTNQSGQIYDKLSDINDEKAAFKATIPLDHDKLMKLSVAASTAPLKQVKESSSIPEPSPQELSIEEIENPDIIEYTAPNIGAFDKYADQTKGISKQEAENFRKKLEYATNDEEKLKVVLEFTTSAGGPVSSFYRR